VADAVEALWQDDPDRDQAGGASTAFYSAPARPPGLHAGIHEEEARRGDRQEIGCRITRPGCHCGLCSIFPTMLSPAADVNTPALQIASKRHTGKSRPSNLPPGAPLQSGEGLGGGAGKRPAPTFR